MDLLKPMTEEESAVWEKIRKSGWKRFLRSRALLLGSIALAVIEMGWRLVGQKRVGGSAVVLILPFVIVIWQRLAVAGIRGESPVLLTLSPRAMWEHQERRHRIKDHPEMAPLPPSWYLYSDQRV